MTASNSKISNLLGLNCGIYKISNLINGKCYIGSSKDLKMRKRVHFALLRDKKHSNPHLQRAYDKYGVENFSFEILEIGEIDDLKVLEKEWLIYFDSYKNGYNRTMDTIAPTRGRVIPIEERAKQWKYVKMIGPNGNIAEAPSLKEFSEIRGLDIANVSAVMLGKVHQTHGYRKFDENIVGIPFNKSDHKKAMVKLSSCPISFKLICPKGVVYEGKNIKEFCRKMDIDNSAIHQVLGDKQNNHRGWRKYTPELEGVPFEGAIKLFNVHYKFISPDGNIYEGNGVSTFARRFNLSVRSMNAVNIGKIRSHNGWQNHREDGKYPKMKLRFKKFKLINQNTGQIVSGENLKNFATEYNLCYNNLQKVFSGKYKQCKGWEIYVE